MSRAPSQRRGRRARRTSGTGTSRACPRPRTRAARGCAARRRRRPGSTPSCCACCAQSRGLPKYGAQRPFAQPVGVVGVDQQAADAVARAGRRSGGPARPRTSPAAGPTSSCASRAARPRSSGRSQSAAWPLQAPGRGRRGRRAARCRRTRRPRRRSAPTASATGDEPARGAGAPPRAAARAAPARARGAAVDEPQERARRPRRSR